MCVRACVRVFSHASVHGRTFTSARARSQSLHSPPPFLFLFILRGPHQLISFSICFFFSFFQARQAQKWAPSTRGTAPRIWRASWGRRKRVVTTQIKSKQRKKKKSILAFRAHSGADRNVWQPALPNKKRKTILAYINSQVKFIILTETWFLCRL